MTLQDEYAAWLDTNFRLAAQPQALQTIVDLGELAANEGIPAA